MPYEPRRRRPTHYATHPRTGTVHLVERQGATLVTLCGRLPQPPAAWQLTPIEPDDDQRATCGLCSYNSHPYGSGPPPSVGLPRPTLVRVVPVEEGAALAAAAELDNLPFDYEASLASALEKLDRGAVEQLRETTLTLTEVLALLRLTRPPLDI